MRYLVNGEETDLAPNTDVRVGKLPDRLAVHTSDGSATALSVRIGSTVFVSHQGRVFEVERPGSTRARSKKLSQGDAKAPMPGQIVDVFVEQGEQVHLGQKLLVLEAMKMQHAVTASFAGVVTQLPVSKGDQVDEGQLLVHVEAHDEQQL